MARQRQKLGEILIKEGLITEEQLQKALQTQLVEEAKLGEILVKLELVSEKDIAIALGKQLGIPYVSLSKGQLKPAEDEGLEDLFPADFARRYKVLPISRHFNSLTVAMVDPSDLIVLDNLKKITGCEINPIISTQSEIEKAIEEFYGKQNLLKEAIESSYRTEEELKISEETMEEESLSLDTLIAKAEEAPVVKLVDLIIRQAIEERASDIHLEPFKDKIVLRYRIDGILHEIPPPAQYLRQALISRIKILAKLDIAEKRLPQDGGFMVKIGERVVDIRVSIIPTIYGEKAVLRLLDKSQVPLDLKELGFEAKELEIFHKAISSPYGLVFLTGPTGSGKTTTLYAALNAIKSPRINILTVEDPVEYRFEGINQVQVKPQIGLTFATALRSFLRQDPDVILVGEVRDLETAEICIRASLTGHLVLSTVHTNDAPTAIGRLIDIGVERYLLAPSLLLVAAQRLVRKLCPECKEPYEPSKEFMQKEKIVKDLLYRHKGCPACNQTGYKGRIGIFEIMPISERIRALIEKGSGTDILREAARSEGMLTLWESGMQKVAQGITDVEEVMRVTLTGGE
ncbi:MAG: Flp pilus assembly complex ATPase component TadA [Candidatus Omnitrophica bacterium]|nr:Flp pilus assembly complex ATPase component TadA [Candidatus Omnitrophota bacterium]